jgi:hypothetical protein
MTPESFPPDADALRDVRLALVACCTAGRALLETLAASTPRAERQRWIVRRLTETHYERLRVPVAGWKMLADADALRKMAEFARLAEAVAAVKGLHLQQVPGPLAGWGPSTPALIASCLLRTALTHDPQDLTDASVEFAIHGLAEFLPPYRQRIRAIAPLISFEAETVPVRLDSELSIDALSTDETLEYWPATQYAYAVEEKDRYVFPAPLAIKGELLVDLAPPSKDRSDRLRDRVLRAVHLMRLVCAGAQSVPWLLVFAHGPTGSGGSHQYGISPLAEAWHPMTLRSHDALALVELWNASDANPAAPVLESLRWFGQSRERSREEDRAVDLITAAEALFLADADGELKYRLALRAARYTATGETPRMDVFRHMKTAYDIRSSIVHGASPRVQKSLKGERLADFSARTEEVLRRAILRALGDRQLPDWDRLVLDV